MPSLFMQAMDFVRDYERDPQNRFPHGRIDNAYIISKLKEMGLTDDQIVAVMWSQLGVRVSTKVGC